MYSLRATERFLRTAARFLGQHRDLEDLLAAVAALLCQDPFHPSLKTHALKGSLSGIHAVRLTYRYRSTLLIVVKERTVTLLDIGSHDDVY